MIELALPTLALQAARLGLEVLDAEQRGLKYSEAVQRVEFIKMQRVYYATLNVLQQPLPAPIQKVLRKLVRHAASGDFDPSRKVLFAVATRPLDAEAALCRFLLWVAVRVNLLVLTWSKPEVETLGVLQTMEDRAEAMMRELLDVSQMQEPDVRPLHVLVSGMLHETWRVADRTLIHAVNEWGSDFEEIMDQAELLGRVRKLDARSAATLPSVCAKEEIGSQQIVDRFPLHFENVSAMEKHRSRLRRSIPTKTSKKRFIDVLRDIGGSP